MNVAEGNCEFIADLPPNGARLRKSEMMSMSWFSVANQTGLSRDIFEVLGIF